MPLSVETAVSSSGAVNRASAGRSRGACCTGGGGGGGMEKVMACAGPAGAWLAGAGADGATGAPPFGGAATTSGVMTGTEAVRMRSCCRA